LGFGCELGVLDGTEEGFELGLKLGLELGVFDGTCEGKILGALYDTDEGFELGGLDGTQASHQSVGIIITLWVVVEGRKCKTGWNTSHSRRFQSRSAPDASPNR
jgi:hypothetical protein